MEPTKCALRWAGSSPLARGGLEVHALAEHHVSMAMSRSPLVAN